MSETEQKAIALGNSRKELRKELNSAKSLLVSSIAKHFDSPRFDFERKRLIGDDGYYLQWLVRKNPSEPESYENQQTSRGHVELLRGPGVEYIGDCTGIDAETIHEFDESAETIDYREFRRFVGKRIVDELNKDYTVKISEDWHITFERGMLDGRAVVCMHHSSIHYFWTIDDPSAYTYRLQNHDEPDTDGFAILHGGQPIAFTETRDHAKLICAALTAYKCPANPS